MSDPRQLLEEYLDGVLSDDAHRDVEEALSGDADLRAELERARRFDMVLNGLHDVRAEERAVLRVLAAVDRPRGRLLRIGLLVTAAAAAIAVAVVLAGRGDRHDERTATQINREWLAFGHRLGEIAEERRTGRVPRKGIGGLEIPQSRGYGIVFEGSLDAMGIQLDDDVREQVKDLVMDHFVAMVPMGRDAAGEHQRAEASLALFRKLRSVAGTEVADAYYDVFRPALATPRSVGCHIDEVLKADYDARYARAVSQLRGRYGEKAVSVALARLSGEDRRFLHRDAAQDGVGRDAVLAIRARLYRVAVDAGVSRLCLL